MINFNSELWSEWCCICNKYLKIFCEKHGYDWMDAKNLWVANFNGTICLCGDEYVSMEDIIVDIEMDAPEEEFLKWYWYSVDAYTVGEYLPNYHSWLNGCPRLTKEEMDKKISTHKHTTNQYISDNDKIKSFKKELNDLIDEYTKDGKI